MKRNQAVCSRPLFPLLLSLTLFISGCANVTISRNAQDENNQSYPKLTYAKDDNFVVLVTKKSDSLASLARKYLGDESKAWVIADFNEITKIVPKREIVIPLKQLNNSGVTIHGLQSVPILCYHRFGDEHTKLAVSKESFRRQMQYLKDNNFRVIPLKDVYEFLHHNKPLPKKSVVITIDDGYRSTYDTAYPILAEFNFPATLFLYTDFTGARDAVTWKQSRAMHQSGLIDIQPHSKTHPNMSLMKIDESQDAYKERIIEEIQSPEKQIKKRIKNDMHTFAYPYGDTNKVIIQFLKKRKYKLGVTVQPGTNTAFAHPFMLRRTMVFGDHSISDFAQALVTFKEKNLK